MVLLKHKEQRTSNDKYLEKERRNFLWEEVDERKAGTWLVGRSLETYGPSRFGHQ